MKWVQFGKFTIEITLLLFSVTRWKKDIFHVTFLDDNLYAREPWRVEYEMNGEHDTLVFIKMIWYAEKSIACLIELTEGLIESYIRENMLRHDLNQDHQVTIVHYCFGHKVSTLWFQWYTKIWKNKVSGNNKSLCWNFLKFKHSRVYFSVTSKFW